VAKIAKVRVVFPTPLRSPAITIVKAYSCQVLKNLRLTYRFTTNEVTLKQHRSDIISVLENNIP
jgi:hypothetical protein